MFYCDKCGAGTPSDCKCRPGVLPQSAPAPAPAPTTSVDEELAALKAVAAALHSVTPESRRRILEWSSRYYDVFQNRY
jgi:hypothetical protein